MSHPRPPLRVALERSSAIVTLSAIVALSAIGYGGALARAQDAGEAAAAPPAVSAPAPAPTPSPPTSAKVVELEIRGAIEDAVPEKNPFGSSRLHFKGLLDLLAQVARDPEVKGVRLRSSSPAIGLARALELRRALLAVKETGKKIYVFEEDFGTLDLLLLSTASRIEAPGSALIALTSPRSEAFYYKGLLDRLGVKVLVSHIGDYKTAFENMARDSMSPAQREVVTGLVTGARDAIAQAIAQERGVPSDRVLEALERGLLTAPELVELGLIDEVASERHFWGDVKADLGVDSVEVVKGYGRKATTLDLQNPFALFQIIAQALSPPKRRATSEEKLALIYANGMILPGKSQPGILGDAVLGSETLIAALREAEEDDSIKAIVLRINSPGGSGGASDAIWEAVRAARARKPVVASMGDVAASGGYYIAMGANKVLAEERTITGSIGVVSAAMNLRGTMDLLGIRVEQVSSSKGADLFSPFTPPEEVPLEVLTKAMETFYWQFVDKAAAGRGMDRDTLHAVAQGRVWTGREALDRGLVDQIGGLEDAIREARELAAIPTEAPLRLLELPPAPDFFEAISQALELSRVEACASAGGPGAFGAPAAWLERLAAPEVGAALRSAARMLELVRCRCIAWDPTGVTLR